ncbi:ParB/RepB/Spo0J family partition protein [Parachitinimonas caeni]|uniref:ParB/RepB/Spo0J family partition protein n=1 Tax=Parachitinimonas caeni TaxID=3031301 RepID=A0ABT7E5R5_9NEIS|nr:ParB/RepB/Spo0J family partition protein [Parachitinimonas caeni]MDK2126252.1 ParB/RepB/Spo0J family partition protein [Parachitinimonas caeni]
MASALAARAEQREGRAEQAQETARAIFNFQEGDRKQTIPCRRIKRSPFQPRVEFDHDELAKLAILIQETNGVVEPILVREIVGDPDFDFELLAGERRLIAVRDHLGWESIEALIRICDDSKAVLITAVENLGRVDLSDYEKSKLIAPLQETGAAKTYISLARVLGESERTIHRLFAFQSLPTQLVDFLDKNPKLITGTYIEQTQDLLQRDHLDLVIAACSLVNDKKLTKGKPMFDWISRQITGPKSKTEVKIRNQDGAIVATMAMAVGKRGSSIQIKTPAKGLDIKDLGCRIETLLNELSKKTI